MCTTPKFLVVIGASAGGLNALAEMVQHLEPGMDVAYCIVLHLSRKAIGDFVVHRLKQVTTLPCFMVSEEMPIEKGCIYVARPNLHMLVKDNKFILGAGPEENRWRPSIDVLFRSAAVAYSSYAIGIILSGYLDDGTSGMWAIKRSGGSCIVQDPNQAEYPDMPLSVINNMEVDHVVSLAEMGTIIARITKNSSGEKLPVPEDVIAESLIAEKTAIGIEDVDKLGQLSTFACPDCGGNLWHIKDDIISRYRCHIGHAYSEADLMVKQSEAAVATLWVALRMMEERCHLLRKMQEQYTQRGYATLVTNTSEKQAALQDHIDMLKKILSDQQHRA